MVDEWILDLRTAYEWDLQGTLRNRKVATKKRKDVILKFIVRQIRRFYSLVLPKTYLQTRNISGEPRRTLAQVRDLSEFLLKTALESEQPASVARFNA